MRNDLLHAQASVDWAVAQFSSLEERIAVWLSQNVETCIKDPDPNVPNNVIVAVEKTPLPFFFVVEVGAYINAIRSSLDILATALAYRYNMSNPDKFYFPIARSQDAFKLGDYKGVAWVRGLPTAEREIIEALQPYQNGNVLLYALHHLDIVRKHRRLLETAIWPVKFSIAGWGLRDSFTPVAGFVSVGSNGEAVLGLHRGYSTPTAEACNHSKPDHGFTSTGVACARLKHSEVRLTIIGQISRRIDTLKLSWPTRSNFGALNVRCWDTNRHHPDGLRLPRLTQRRVRLRHHSRPRLSVSGGTVWIASAREDRCSGWKDWSKHFSAVSGRSKAWLKLEAYCVFVGLALIYPLELLPKNCCR